MLDRALLALERPGRIWAAALSAVALVALSLWRAPLGLYPTYLGNYYAALATDPFHPAADNPVGHRMLAPLRDDPLHWYRESTPYRGLGIVQAFNLYWLIPLAGALLARAAEHRKLSHSPVEHRDGCRGPHGAALAVTKESRRSAVAATAPDPAWQLGLVLTLVVLLAIAYAWRTETSRDFGFHLATGRWMLEHRAWPQVDSFTVPSAGRPYIDMHGLFQLALVAAYRFGMPGVGLLRVGLVLAALCFMWRNARDRGVTSAVWLGAGFGLAVCAWELRFMARPEMASYVCLAAMLWLLGRHARGGTARWLYAAIPLQLVWVYSHALSLFGIAVLGLYAATSLVRGMIARRVDRAPWVTLAGACAVMFLNPYGARGVAFLWELRTRLQSGNAFGESIAELMSPFSAQAAGVVPLVAFKVLLIGTALVVLLRARKLSLFDLAIVAMFGVLAATHVRNVGLFVVAATPVAIEAAALVSAWLGARAGSLRAVRVVALPLVAMGLALMAWRAASGATYAVNHRPVAFGSAESQAVFPIRTLGLIEDLRLEGPLFNTLDFGGYLLQHGPAGQRVFVDGRLEVMSERFYAEYSAVVAGEGWDRMVAQYHPATALVSTPAHALVDRIHADPAWQVIDADGAAVLFARVAPAPLDTTAPRPALPDTSAGRSAMIAASTARLATLDSAAAPGEERFPVPPRAGGLTHNFGRHRVAFEAWGRGNAFNVLGMPNAARREYQRALRESDQLEPALVKSYVAVAVKLQRFDEARDWCRRLVELTPDDHQARTMLSRLESR